MNIGFDLDKVLINHPPYISSAFIDRLHKDPKSNELSYRLPSKPEQILRIFSHYRLFRPLAKENFEFVKELARNNTNKHYLISGRFGFLEKKTAKLIKTHHFDKVFTDMFFNFENKQPHIFKDEIIKRLHIDCYIDDDLDLLHYLSERNPRTTFYWLNKKKIEQLRENLFAVRNLKHIFLQL